ncbi:MAG TPA: type II toxin-antitoxin system prevent-host-death family antitoxin [Dokdonella sp.]
MDEPVSAADANRNFSQLLRAVRDERATYVVTSHGKPVAKIVPYEADGELSARARALLLARLAEQPVANVADWTRDELYERAQSVARPE